MRFGIGPYDLVLHNGQPLAEAYEEMLEQAVFAEDQSFDSVWLGERHFTAEQACSSSETAAAAVAVRTNSLRIGVMPAIGLSNPLYTAEDLAVLDCINNGRTIAAFRTDLGADELAAYKIAPGEARERSAEALAIIAKAWAPTEFSHQGKYWKVPANDFKGNPFAEGVRELSVTPKPAQLRLPVWIATQDRSTIESAARMGYTWLGSPLETIASLHEKHELYVRTAAGSGRATEGLLFPVVREVYVAETAKEARATVQEGILALYKAYKSWGLLDGSETNFDALARDRFIVGDVDQVVSEIRRYRDEAGVNYIVCRMAFPGTNHSRVMEAIKFFGRAVIPEFRMASFPPEIRIRTRA